jgi:hypothetical protein
MHLQLPHSSKSHPLVDKEKQQTRFPTTRLKTVSVIVAVLLVLGLTIGLAAGLTLGGRSNEPSSTADSTSNDTLPSFPGSKSLYCDFSHLPPSIDVVSYLDECGLRISTDFIPSTPLPHLFTRENVRIGEGKLEMIVNSTLRDGAVLSAELATKDKILFGSITTTGKISKVGGVCDGEHSSFTRREPRETDVERARRVLLLRRR